MYYQHYTNFYVGSIQILKAKNLMGYSILNFETYRQRILWLSMKIYMRIHMMIPNNKMASKFNRQLNVTKRSPRFSQS